MIYNNYPTMNCWSGLALRDSSNEIARERERLVARAFIDGFCLPGAHVLSVLEVERYAFADDDGAGVCNGAFYRDARDGNEP